MTTDHVVLDLTALAALAPEAAELTRRVRAGDLDACFDAGELNARADALAAPAAAFLEAMRAVVDPASNDRSRLLHACDGLGEIAAVVSGTAELQTAVDESRDDCYPD